MVKKTVGSVGGIATLPLLHTEMPSAIALCSMCCFLTLVEIEVETQPSIVIIHSSTSFVLQLGRQDVGDLLAFSFSLRLALRKSFVVEDNKMYEAEAVIKLAEQVKQAEEEQFAMERDDPLRLEAQAVQPTVFDDDAPTNPGAEMVIDPGAASAGHSSVPMDPGLMVPTTSPRTFAEVESLRAVTTTRRSDGGGDTANAKRQRISRIQREYEERLSAVKVAYKEYFILDDYSIELDVENGVESYEDDVWDGEDHVELSGIPKELWSDHAVDSTPDSPEPWVDDELADRIEVQRLVAMNVLVPACEFHGEITGKLTTRFVHDWPVKDYVNYDGVSEKKWMRRPRYVAREFAHEKRLDTFSPATGAHRSNLLPLKYVGMKEAIKDLSQSAEYDFCLGAST